MDKIIIQDLHIQAVIGVNPGERVIKQNIIITITAYKDLSKCGSSDNVNDTVSYSSLSKSICSYSESSHHYTLEALATGVAKICCLGFGIEKVKILVQKPGAIKLAKCPAVQIERTLEYFKSNSFVEIPSKVNIGSGSGSSGSSGNSKTGGGRNIVYLAFGSNIGDKFQNILNSFKKLEKHCFIESTSFMYQSLPQYYLEQDLFLNCACKVTTDLSAFELLKFIKQIEYDEMGRKQSTFRNAPRIIDIDIIYFNNEIIKTDQLEIPHPLMWERSFVVLPLCDIAPNFIHPTLHITSSRLKLNLTSNLNLEIEKVFRIINATTSSTTGDGSQGTNDGKEGINWNLNKKTFIMGILNVTPDSFVDGGKYDSIEKSMQQCKKLIDEGADIIDIGGQSSYPGAQQITIQEEIDRVIPVIKKIREVFGNDIPLSIDTYNHEVAKQAIQAGCNIINDISGGMKDPNILLIAKEFRVPIILNHSQPTTQYLQQKQYELKSSSSNSTNNDQLLPPIDYSNPSVINTVISFFKERVETATKLGLYRWQIILDPGLGFYKTFEQSIEILQKGKEIMNLGFPVLIGPSRKGFIASTISKGYDNNNNTTTTTNTSTTTPPSSNSIPPNSDRRLWGTIACCCIGSMWGVNIIRIHDIPEIRDSMLITDSVYRPKQYLQPSSSSSSN